jgi:uncharacterized RDD family membrane protein YckC
MAIDNQSEKKIDTRAQVITPENIAFEYALAGPFLRLPAFLFDLAFRVFVFVGLIFLLSLFSAFAPVGTGLIATVFLILLFFFLSWFYGIFCETRFNGRTFGKMVFKLRTISTDGRPINASQAALRNFLRLADMGVLLPLQILSSEAAPAFVIPTMSLGLIAMFLSRRFQRIGDMAAGTMVVVEGGQLKPWNLAPEDARAFGLSEMIPANFVASRALATTVGLYMENRKRLSGPRRDEIASHVSSQLLPEFGMLPDTGPDLLMCALYTRIFMSEQQREEGMARFRQSAPHVAGRV